MGFDILLSTVSEEFAKDHPVWGQSRQKLTPYLRRGGASVCVQEDFGQSHLDTLQKLDAYVRDCTAVVHLVGGLTGKCPDPDDLIELMDRFSQEQSPLLGNESHIRITDLTAVTYTQWEALLAIHYGKPLFVYATREGQTTQAEHLARLKLAKNARFHDDIVDREDLIGKVLADLRQIMPDIPELRVNNVPASIGATFVGRDPLFDPVYQLLLEKPTVIHGLGGLGKTRFAIEFAHHFAARFSTALFTRADGFADLTGPEALNLPEHNDDLETRRHAVVAKLQTAEKPLLIFDNIDTETDKTTVEALAARLPNVAILITSRIGKWNAKFNRQNLDFLSPAAARAFLIDRSGTNRPATDSDQADLDRLVGAHPEVEWSGTPFSTSPANAPDPAGTECHSILPVDAPATSATDSGLLGGLALAIEQAGAYIDAEEISFGQYLQQFEKNRERILAWKSDEFTEYEDSVLTTWQTTIDHLSDGAVALLRELSFYASAPIPRDIFEENRDALSELHRFSMVRYLAEPEHTVTIHPLVQEIVLLRMTDEEKAETWQSHIQHLTAWAPVNGQKFENWATWELLAPHADRFVEWEPQFPETADCGRVLNAYAGFQQYRNGAYAKAEPLKRRVLDLRERHLGPEHTDALTSVNNLAALLYQSSNYAEAELL